ncbi:hypothetical protein FQN50_005627 [Emmonsiellopsis sp. PD_5]|nr:hypothetical protein FQN50_005627 [Emmonsiellopsis sp. PD_5]
MASFKDSARPVSHAHNTTPPLRQSAGRHHSHSVSLGAVNLNHRVTRRKSMTSTAASNAAAAAVAAVLGDSGNTAALSTSASSHRRGLGSRRAVESSSMGTSSGFGSYLARDAAAARRNSPNSIDENTAVEDVSSSLGGGGGPAKSTPISTKQRSRRASEGSHLIRSEGKRVMNELRWEHDPAWAYTSKLLISKHQQVQLLEAATVLVNMNPETTDTTTTTSSDTAPTTNGESDRSSASPTASGISELRDGLSSTETTPPPVGEEGRSFTKSGYHNHRFSANSANFSRSFQSIPSSSFTGSAPSFSPSRSHFRQSSTDTRPSTAETNGMSMGLGLLDDDEAGLAAAIELCNFGTPRSGPTIPMSPDVPPVPPLPARFLGQSVSSGHAINSSVNLTGAGSGSGSFGVPLRADASSTPTIYNSLTIHPPLSYKVSDVREVRMDDAAAAEKSRSNGGVGDDDFAQDHDRDRMMDDDDDGVFGRMEE